MRSLLVLMLSTFAIIILGYMVARTFFLGPQQAPSIVVEAERLGASAVNKVSEVQKDLSKEVGRLADIQKQVGELQKVASSGESGALLREASRLSQDAINRISSGTGEPSSGAPFCEPGKTPQFVFGFATLKEQVGAAMGEPLECEHPQPENGDTLQITTTGLAYYRKSTNTPTFTDGSRHWALTDKGLVEWTGESIDPPASGR